MDLGLRGRRALVTGGSKGIGYAVAEELVREGAHVAICARHQDEVDAAAAQLRAGGATVHAQVADVTVPEQVTDFVEAAAAALGGIDVLVNNAGAAHPGTFATLADEDWQADLDATPPRSPVSSPSWPATGPATSPGLDRRGRRDGPLRLSRPGGGADVALADALTAKQS
jgi:NAD(P)-dependent dehydrogenase (short-subunit alcohol dehydrogenase family)